MITASLAVLAAPIVGVVMWLWAARRMPDAAAPRNALDLLPWLGWARSRRSDPDSAPYRLAIEAGAVAAAVWAVLAAPPAWAWATAAMGWLLLAASVVDVRERLLPNSMNLALGALGLATAAMIGRAALLDRAIGAAAGYAAFVAVAFVFARLRGRDGLGRGDAKMLAAIGAWVGWQGLASVVLIAAAGALIAIGVASRRARAPMRADASAPFGPFLAAGAWLTWLYGPLGFALARG